MPYGGEEFVFAIHVPRRDSFDHQALPVGRQLVEAPRARAELAAQAEAEGHRGALRDLEAQVAEADAAGAVGFAADMIEHRKHREPAVELEIARLPHGYATIVGERGLALSAGERQRVALARAFLADPAVLVLDEPTAALDAVAQRQVIDGYQGVMRGRTTILITHRKEVAMAADHVVVLDGARVVDAGAPRDLAERSAAFARLFEIDRGAGVALEP